MKKHTASAIAALFLLASLAWPVLAIDIGAMPNPSFYDSTNGVAKVETQMGSGPTCAAVTADTQCKSSAGFVHLITVSQSSSAAPTAGVVTLYDNSAESGNAIWSAYFSTAVLVPISIPIDKVAANGIYLGVDGTLAGLKFTVSFR